RSVAVGLLRGCPESPGGAKGRSLGREPQVGRPSPHPLGVSPGGATEPQETPGLLSPLRGFGAGRDVGVRSSWRSRPRLRPATPFGAQTTSRIASEFARSRKGEKLDPEFSCHGLFFHAELNSATPESPASGG